MKKTNKMRSSALRVVLRPKKEKKFPEENVEKETGSL